MALDDLDLEFEDEEEQKKDDALEVDVDLNFSAAGNSPSVDSKTQGQASGPQNAAPAKPSAQAAKPTLSADDVTDPNLRIPKNIQNKSKAPSKPTPTRPAQVKSLDEARRNAANKSQAAQAKVIDQRQARSAPQSQPTPSPSGESLPDVGYTTDYQSEMQTLREEIQALKEEMKSVQHIAEVKVAVAEAKAEFVTEYMSNAKLMDHQVNQILQRIHTKVPQLKNEVLTIKKYIGEFIKKSSGNK